MLRERKLWLTVLFGSLAYSNSSFADDTYLNKLKVFDTRRSGFTIDRNINSAKTSTSGMNFPSVLSKPSFDGSRRNNGKICAPKWGAVGKSLGLDDNCVDEIADAGDAGNNTPQKLAGLYETTTATTSVATSDSARMSIGHPGSVVNTLAAIRNTAGTVAIDDLGTSILLSQNVVNDQIQAQNNFLATCPPTSCGVYNKCMQEATSPRGVRIEGMGRVKPTPNEAIALCLSKFGYIPGQGATGAAATDPASIAVNSGLGFAELAEAAENTNPYEQFNWGRSTRDYIESPDTDAVYLTEILFVQAKDCDDGKITDADYCATVTLKRDIFHTVLGDVKCSLNTTNPQGLTEECSDVPPRDLSTIDARADTFGSGMDFIYNWAAANYFEILRSYMSDGCIFFANLGSQVKEQSQIKTWQTLATRDYTSMDDYAKSMLFSGYWGSKIAKDVVRRTELSMERFEFSPNMAEAIWHTVLEQISAIEGDKPLYDAGGGAAGGFPICKEYLGNKGSLGGGGVATKFDIPLDYDKLMKAMADDVNAAGYVAGADRKVLPEYIRLMFLYAQVRASKYVIDYVDEVKRSINKMALTQDPRFVEKANRIIDANISDKFIEAFNENFPKFQKMMEDFMESSQARRENRGSRIVTYELSDIGINGTGAASSGASAGDSF
jgi:hypothetical protein